MREKGIPIYPPERTLFDEAKIQVRRAIKWVMEKLGPIAPFVRAAVDLGVKVIHSKLGALLGRRRKAAEAKKPPPDPSEPLPTTAQDQPPPTTPSGAGVASEGAPSAPKKESTQSAPSAPSTGEAPKKNVVGSIFGVHPERPPQGDTAQKAQMAKALFQAVLSTMT